MRPIPPIDPSDTITPVRRQNLLRAILTTVQERLPKAAPSSDDWLQSAVTEALDNFYEGWPDTEYPVSGEVVSAADMLAVVSTFLAIPVKPDSDTEQKSFAKDSETIALAILKEGIRRFPTDLSLPLYACRLRYNMALQNPAHDSEGISRDELLHAVHTDVVDLLHAFAGKDRYQSLSSASLSDYAEAFLLESDLQERLGQGASPYTQTECLLGAAKLFADLQAPLLQAECYDRVGDLDIAEGNALKALGAYMEASACAPAEGLYAIKSALCSLHGLNHEIGLNHEMLYESFYRLTPVIESHTLSEAQPIDDPDLIMAMLLRKKLAIQDFKQKLDHGIQNMNASFLLSLYEVDIEKLRRKGRLSEAFQTFLSLPPSHPQEDPFFGLPMPQQLEQLTKEIEAVKGYPQMQIQPETVQIIDQIRKKERPDNGRTAS